MSAPREMDRDRVRLWMMAALDDEIAAEDRARLEAALREDAALREEWTRLRRVKEVTSTMKYGDPPEEVWDGYWRSVYNRVERGIGWILISFGVTVLLGYAAWESVRALLESTSMPPLLKLATAAVVLGSVVLCVSVFRERWLGRHKDPYEEVRR